MSEGNFRQLQGALTRPKGVFMRKAYFRPTAFKPMIMQRILLSVFSVLVGFGLSAQITITNDYFPVAGDSLTTATDDAPAAAITVGNAGANQTWDYSSLQAINIQSLVFNTAASGPFAADFPSADLRGTLPGGVAEGYYITSDNALTLVGYAGGDPIGQGIELSAPLDPGNVVQWAPLAFGDSRNSTSNFLFAFSIDDLPGNILDSLDLPIVPDSLRVVIGTDRTDEIDAWGTLDLPDGTYDVLREKRTLMQEIRVEAKISILPWFDITDLLVGSLPIPGIGMDTTVSYYFWTDDSKEPAALVMTTSPEDDTPTSVTYKYASPSSTGGPELPQVELNVFPNPAINNVTFQFQDLPLDFYRLEIYNVLGQPMQRESYYLSGDHTTSIDVSNYKRGIYLYRLLDGQGNLLLTRRLMLSRP